MKWRDAVLRVLREADEPLHYVTIAQRIVDNEYRTKVGATPAATVAVILGNPDVRPLVRRVERGVYAIAASPTADPGTGPRIGQSGATEESPENDLDTKPEMGLINAFGMFWNRSEIDWSSRTPKLLGVQQSGADPVDFGMQGGVYLLYDGNRVVYVGRANVGRLGPRLWDHTRDRLASRWDRLSWFGVRGVKPEDGTLALAQIENIGLDVLIATMEALLIEGLEPPQNRRQGDGFAALEYIQFTDPKVKERRTQNLLLRAVSELGT